MGWINRVLLWPTSSLILTELLFASPVSVFSLGSKPSEFGTERKRKSDSKVQPVITQQIFVEHIPALGPFWIRYSVSK